MNNSKNTRIYDPIHGFIEITPLMKTFIDTIEFQRLRNLKQLGVTSYVFTSATHTRFEHSIGVSHLAGLMMESIKKNNPELNVTDKQIELCRLAGLLHDIGHGPFSHLFDHHVKKESMEEHEERGCEIIKKMVKKYNIDLCEDDVTEILRMIVPGGMHVTNWKYQIVANKINQLDVDKLDYIQRDCFYLDQKYCGEFSRIIKDAKVFRIDNFLQICWPIKLQYEIFQLFSSRYRLHKQVYNHYNVKAIEYVVIDILKEVMEFKEWDDVLGDSMIHLKKDNRIYNRDHPKFVGELTLFNKKKKKLNKIIEYLNENNILWQKVIIGFGGNKNPLKYVRFYKNNEIIDGSLKFSFMVPSNYKEILIRIYSKGKEDYREIYENHYKKILDIYNE